MQIKGARAALWALTAMNMLNYVDRYVVAALLPSLQSELHLDDSQAGLLGTAFMVSYFLVSPLFGWVGDRGRRPRWLALGVGLWSVATAAGALARGLVGLVMARAAVGVGEAAYGAIAPSLLADYYPKGRRGRMLSYFYLATPVGSALGYLLGGLLGAAWGWRVALSAVGLPGLFLAGWAYTMREPVRGGSEVKAAQAPLPWRHTFAALWRNRLYVGTVSGYTAYTFAIGAFAFWTPSYMMRVRGYPQGSGMLTFGAMTVVTGLVGTLLGGLLGDRLLRVSRKGYTWLNVGTVAVAAVFSTLALRADATHAFVVYLVLAQICMFMSTGPVNALIINSVPPNMRATGAAMSIFCIHLFGDAVSPTLVGHLSDHGDLPSAMMMIPGFYLLAAVLWSTTLPRRKAA